MLLSDFGVDESFLAHTPDETLIAHSDLTLAYYQKIVASKKLEQTIDALVRKLDDTHFKLIKEMFDNAIYLHDLGKTNPHFQAKKMSNPLFDKHKNETQSSEHSLLSSTQYIEYYLSKTDCLKDRTVREKLKFILYSFSYHQAKHHGALGVFEEYRKSETNAKSYMANLERLNIPHFEFYILNKLLFSLLVSSDYYATTEYMAKFPINDFGLFSDDDKQKLKQIFDNYLSGFAKTDGINKLRGEMFAEAEKNLLQNLDKNIFYLEAPTGSGKTITSVNLALQLLNAEPNLNKLFYIFPFNTLVEQTRNVFDDIFKNELKIEVINSITPITMDEKNQEDKESEYQKSYISRLFFHSPAVITTHVALFNILFDTSKEDNFPLWQLANSVIILDEIQSYNNRLWWYMVEFFEKYASLLNIKIIIMSATLPKLDFFLENKNSFVDLISTQKRDYFFEHELFKDRVKIDFSLLDPTKKMSRDELAAILDTLPKDKKILFEFIKKQSAREFYDAIKWRFENVCELSGDDNKAHRQFVINKSKEDKPIIIVATQVIEAGVDIDMDIGFKDISTLDGEEQFMGRINRSCKREGLVYFFDMDDVEKIYRDDNRLGFDLKNEKYRAILKNKKFGEYYKEVLGVIQTKGLRYNNGLLTNYDNFAGLVKKLNYKEIASTMTLINSQNFTLYFPFKIDISKYAGVKEFERLDEMQGYLTDGKLDGQKVWDEFLRLDEIVNFPKKEIERTMLNSLMQFFTFSIFRFGKRQEPPFYDDEHGGYFFVANHEDFITEDGKFNRAKYLLMQDDNFL